MKTGQAAQRKAVAASEAAQARAFMHAYKTVTVADLKPWERNPRTHSPAQIKQLQASIREFGFTNPVLVDEKGRIIAGHGRVLAAKAEGLTKVPAIELRGLSTTQKRALVIADNQLAMNAGWDDELLKLELGVLEKGGFDLSMVGFSDRELSRLLGPGTGESDPDDVPPVPAKPTTQRGDVWLLGAHRLMCGDSTKAKDMAHLMGGERAVCSITDPPYSVNYEESHKIRGGNKAVHASYHEADINPTDLLEFLGILPTDLIVFSYSVNRHLYVLAESLKKHRWEVRKELVWVKDQFAFWMGAAYQQRHEPFWICTRANAGFSGNVDSKQSTVLEYARPKSHDLHPTAKPVEMWALLVGNHSNKGELIVEPFSGSGTSIIAAQQLERRCNAMELAPAYVDVAVERWQLFTGQAATLEGQKATFAAIKQKRHGKARAA